MKAKMVELKARFAGACAVEEAVFEKYLENECSDESYALWRAAEKVTLGISEELLTAEAEYYKLYGEEYEPERV